MRPWDDLSVFTVVVWIIIATVALLLLLRLLLRAADLMNDWRQRRGVRVRRAQIGIGGAARTDPLAGVELTEARPGDMIV